MFQDWLVNNGLSVIFLMFDSWPACSWTFIPAVSHFPWLYYWTLNFMGEERSTSLAFFECTSYAFHLRKNLARASESVSVTREPVFCRRDHAHALFPTDEVFSNVPTPCGRETWRWMLCSSCCLFSVSKFLLGPKFFGSVVSCFLQFSFRATVFSDLLQRWRFHILSSLWLLSFLLPEVTYLAQMTTCWLHSSLTLLFLWFPSNCGPFHLWVLSAVTDSFRVLLLMVAHKVRFGVLCLCLHFPLPPLCTMQQAPLESAPWSKPFAVLRAACRMLHSFPSAAIHSQPPVSAHGSWCLLPFLLLLWAEAMREIFSMSFSSQWSLHSSDWVISSKQIFVHFLFQHQKSQPEFFPSLSLPSAYLSQSSADWVRVYTAILAFLGPADLPFFTITLWLAQLMP